MKCAILSLSLALCISLAHGTSTSKHYIVYMGEHSFPNSESVVAANHDMLVSVLGSSDRARVASIHQYSKSFRGFSAMLTPNQAHQLSERDGVLSVFQSKMNKIHTTRSWEFLGLDGGGFSVSSDGELTVKSEYDVIVGSIDTGVWPESKSFDDAGLGPVPSRFKGECITGERFSLLDCNRKIVGARFYSQGFEAENGPLESFGGGIFFRSARDSDGHGSHTASTALGSKVTNASLLGLALGTARGGAPHARLAVYKACWFNLCNSADLLAAFDDAIHDGVDIISISAGPLPPQPSFFEETISIGAFHAFRNGVLVSASAGNSGLPGTATNVAPWILTVAASSIDRGFESDVFLGNSQVIKGESTTPLELKGFFGIIVASNAAAPGVPATNASFCKNNTLDPSLIEGKIVVCTIETVADNRTEKAIFIKQGGGVGMILIDPVAKDVGFQYVIPTTAIDLNEAKKLQAYLSNGRNLTVSIGRTITILNTKPAPEMAVFSSMGPNIVTPDIIKPDVTAPGLNILAAWSPVAVVGAGQRSVDFNILSGTSMSCPHVTGVAAFVKSCRPSWGPSAIKSALMTTATLRDNTNGSILREPQGSSTTPFDFGSGHLNPVAALDPGLVYDLDTSDIISFLCSYGSSPMQLKNLTGELESCSTTLVPSYNLNYPSIGVVNMTGNVSVYRTVTNYGEFGSVYVGRVESPPGVSVELVPEKLEFRRSGEKMSYRLDFMPLMPSNGSFVFGSITWSDGKHIVHSPIALNVVSV